MATINFSRSVCRSRNITKIISFPQTYITTTTISVVSEAGQCESPELAAAKPFSEIPAITSFPLIGSSWIYFPIIGKYNLQKQHKADEDKEEKYGNIVREKIGHLDIVTCYHPEAQEVMAKHEGKYPDRGVVETIKAYRESRKEWYKSTGILILSDHEWHDLRSKTQKHLMKPKTIQAYLQPMQSVARDLVKRIYEKRNQSMEVDGLLEDLHKWALESVAYVGLDTRLGCLNSNLPPDADGPKLIKSIQTQLDCMNKLEPLTGNLPLWKYIPTPTWNKYVKHCDVFTEIAFKHINRAFDDLKKHANEDRDMTMLQAMLLTKGLDKSGIMVTVADMLFAGVDTTSHSVAFLLYHLAKNPQKQKILRDEVWRLLPNEDDAISPQIFSQLHYLKACIKESMRLFPILRGNARTLDHDVVILGYRIPAKTMIFCILQSVYKSEKYFENPTQFVPERWMDKEAKLSNPFAYAPFGFGVRSCIGRRLAELEIVCLVTEIMRRFEVQYHHEDMDVLTQLINVPDKPLRISFQDQ